MKRRSHSIRATALVLTSTISAAFGGATAGAVIETPPAPAVSPWTFEASLYGWLLGVDGTTGVGPFTSNVDESFSDLLSNIEMAAALRFEARNGRWGFIADGFYAELGASGNPPGPLYDYVDINLKQFIGELDVAYRVYDSPSGFVDLYAGVRYNSLKMDFNGSLDNAGIQAVSDNASARVVNGIRERANAIVQPQVAAYKAAAAVDRAAIESALTADIEAEADGRVKRDLEKQLLEIRRSGGLDARDIASAKITVAVTKQRAELAASTAELKVAQLRASVDASLQADVTAARSRVAQAEKKLASAINKQLASRLPTDASAKEDWLDPIVGVRAQWNINEKWFLAGRSDIGGFSVGSDFVWTVQATVGYNFTRSVSAELGYRYMHTDYTNDAFVYDVANGGIYTSLNIKF
jgi:hypothetical protein